MRLLIRLPILFRTTYRPSTRLLSTSALRMGAGDTGGVRHGGERHADSWTKREKAAEDMYVKEREKALLQLLREKIAEQEAALRRDREILGQMEDQYYDDETARLGRKTV